MTSRRVLYAFQDDLRRGMTIAEACTKHGLSFQEAVENMPTTRKSPKSRKVAKNSKCKTVDKNIQKRYGKYFLRKRVNGKERCYGTYSTLEDAQKIREYCNEHGWKKKSIDSYCEILGVERCKGNLRSEKMFH